ncbi:MAG: right-handed parallel beta-helix repeat-containing protein [Acidobacteriota bacterium]
MLGRGVSVSLFALVLTGSSQAATFTVDDLADAGPGTLRQALLDAEGSAGADVIDFTLPGQVDLLSALPTITESVTIGGDAAGNTLNGDGTFRIVTIEASDVDVVLRDLVLTNGMTFDLGAGLFADVTSSTVTLERCFVTENTAQDVGGGVALIGDDATLVMADCRVTENVADLGGGVIVGGLTGLVMTDCLVADNEAEVGGGIVFAKGPNGGTLTNVTVTGNTSLDLGGGLVVGGLSAPLAIVNCTLAGNEAGTDGGGLWAIIAEIEMTNTILADNGPDDAYLSDGVTFVVNDTNLVESCTPAASPCPAFAFSSDPGLEPISDCGDTQLLELSAGSIAIDAGTLAGAPAADQCGRVRDGSPDLGAAERVSCTTRDFDGFPAGTEISTEFPGLTISGSTPPMIFDTSAVTCDDEDLAAPGPGPGNAAALGAVLILSEVESACAPDDARDGGLLVIELVSSEELLSVGLLDIDEPGTELRTYGPGGGLIESIAVPVQDDNGWQSVALSGEPVARLEIDLAGSGAITDLSCAPLLRRSRVGESREVDERSWRGDSRSERGGSARRGVGR